MSTRPTALLLLLLPLAALAQGHPPPGGPGLRPSPVQLLLQHAQELSLTAAQSQALQAIEAALATQNAPLQQQLEALRPEPPPEPGSNGAPPGAPSEADRAKHEQARALFEQLRSNGDAALQQALAQLSDAQAQKARALLEAERAAHQPPRRGPPPAQQEGSR